MSHHFFVKRISIPLLLFCVAVVIKADYSVWMAEDD